MSVDIYNLSDEDEEDEEDEEEEDENSNSVKSPDSKASVIHRIIEPGPSRQHTAAAALQSLEWTASSSSSSSTSRGGAGGGPGGAMMVTLSTVNEKKNHTEIEPGGSHPTAGRAIFQASGSRREGEARATATTTATNGNIISTNSTSFREDSKSEVGVGSPVNKLQRQRAPQGAALAKQQRPSMTTQATPTTLLDAVLISETSLTEPISPSFIINLPNVPMFSPPPRSAAAVAGPSTSSSSYPLTSMQQPAASSSSNFSSANIFSYQLPGTSHQKPNNSNNSKIGGGGGASNAGELELVLSPAKLGQ